MARRRRRVRRIKYRSNPRRNPAGKLLKKKIFGLPVWLLGAAALGIYFYKKKQAAALPAGTAVATSTGEYLELEANGGRSGGILASRGLGSLS